MTVAKSGSTSGQEEKGFTLPAALATSIALVVAAFAAVGVSGGLLTRAVRNEPEWLAMIIICGLVAAGAAAFLLTESKVVRGAIAGLVLVSGVAVWMGTVSVAQREQPMVSLSLDPKQKDTGSSVLTAEVSGVGLRITNRLLVQIIALNKFHHPDNSTRLLCEQDWSYGGKPLPPRNERFPSERGVLLLSETLGPDQDGKVKATIKLPIDIGKYEGICAYAPLPGDSAEDKDPRTSAAYLNLTAVRPQP